MKNYTITVNGNVYDVTVEENGAAYRLQHLDQQPRQHRQQHRKRQQALEASR